VRIVVLRDTNPGTVAAMASYSLDIDIPGEPRRYVRSHDFPNEMRAGDQFEFDGYTLQVIAVATKQFPREPGEAEETIRAAPA
jgi:hypothetical protein